MGAEYSPIESQAEIPKENNLPREQLLGRNKPTDLVFIPLVPGRFSIHKKGSFEPFVQPSQRRGESKPLEVGFINSPNTKIANGDLVLLALPEKNEEVILKVNTANGTKTILTMGQNQSGEYTYSGTNGIAKVFNEEEQVTLNYKELDDKEYTQISNQGIVKLNGKKYLLVEGTSNKDITLTSPTSLVRRSEYIEPTEFGNSHIGFKTEASPNHRSWNEDYAIIGDTIILCDGMGGHSSGYAASRMAATIINSLLSDPKFLPTNSGTSTIENKMREAINTASAIIKKTLPDGAGTTLVVAKIVGNKLVYANVGDTRLTIFRDNEPIFSSKDHNLLWTWEKEAKDHDGWVTLGTDNRTAYRLELSEYKPFLEALSEDYDVVIDEKRGIYRVRINPSEFESFRTILDTVVDPKSLPLLVRFFYDRRNYISSAVGGGSTKPRNIETETIPLHGKNKILIATDGIIDPLKIGQIREIMSKDLPPLQIAKSLVSRVISDDSLRVKPDDATAVVINFP